MLWLPRPKPCHGLGFGLVWRPFRVGCDHSVTLRRLAESDPFHPALTDLARMGGMQTALKPAATEGLAAMLAETTRAARACFGTGEQPAVIG